MGNYILDFVDGELLKHRRKKEKISELESSYILKETIKKQEEILEEEKNNIEEKSVIIEEKIDERIKDKRNPLLLSELEKEDIKHEIPRQQKDTDSVASKEIMDILEGNNMEKSILSFNGEEEDMSLDNIEDEKIEEKKEKKVIKKKGKMNTILFQSIVGIVLILISFFYLVESPAEQKVLRSGMSIWVDKAKLLLGSSNSYLKNKFMSDLEERKKNLITEIEETLIAAENCELKEGFDIKEDIEQLKNLKLNIEAMSLELFESQHINVEMQVESIRNGEIIKTCY